MNKTEIKIDKNIKYLGEIKNIELPYGKYDRFELPNGILNKDIPISVPLKSGQININQTIPEKGKN